MSPPAHRSPAGSPAGSPADSDAGSPADSDAGSPADDEPRFAAVRFDRDRAGRPVPPARRLEYAERAAVVAYLRESPVVMANWGYDPDPLDPEHPEVVPAHLHTDGRWVWPESLAYFAERYGVPPEPELLAHIEERRYEWPAEVGDEILDRIGRLLREGRTSGSG